MAINIKNYTTVVAASKSIDLIEKLLIDFGAFNIMKEYESGKVQCIAFIIEFEGMRMPFRIDGKVSKVAKWVRKQQKNIADKTCLEKAERIAWKQQYELLHLQLGQIEMDQLEKLEVFFPYLYDVQNRQTYYEKLKASGFKQLTNG